MMKLAISVNGAEPEEINVTNLVIIGEVYVLLLPGRQYYSLGPAA